MGKKFIQRSWHFQSFIFFFSSTNTNCASVGSEGEVLVLLRWMLSSVACCCPLKCHVYLLNMLSLSAIGFLCHWGCASTVYFTVHLWNFQKNRERAAGHCAQKLWSSAWSHCQVQKHTKRKISWWSHPRNNLLQNH